MNLLLGTYTSQRGVIPFRSQSRRGQIAKTLSPEKLHRRASQQALRAVEGTILDYRSNTTVSADLIQDLVSASSPDSLQVSTLVKAFLQVSF